MNTFAVKISQEDHGILTRHLFKDEKESAALLSCGRVDGPNGVIFLVNDVLLIPDRACIERKVDSVIWPVAISDKFLHKCYISGFSVIKVHGHPSGYSAFSQIDDETDREFHRDICSYFNDDRYSASLVFLPEGEVFGRVFLNETIVEPIAKFSIIGDSIQVFQSVGGTLLQNILDSTKQLFGDATKDLFKKLSISVVGCSGLGGPLIEQLVRLGVGELVLVDHDIVESKNLNRITNTKISDANSMKLKVAALKDNISEINNDVVVRPVPYKINTIDAINMVKSSDVVFGCLDKSSPRELINRMSAFYLLPYFDLGATIDADGRGGVDRVQGRVDYIKPKGSSLISRGVIDYDTVTAEDILESHPDQYEDLLQSGYIKGVVEESPSVVSLNSLVSSFAVNELLARLHNYRNIELSRSAQIDVLLHDDAVRFIDESTFKVCSILKKVAGLGDRIPLLERPIFG